MENLFHELIIRIEVFNNVCLSEPNKTFHFSAQVCNNRSGEINPTKIRDLVEGYIKKVKYYRKKENSNGTTTSASNGVPPSTNSSLPPFNPPSTSQPTPPGALLSKGANVPPLSTVKAKA